jgi:hypothetical protein
MSQDFGELQDWSRESVRDWVEWVIRRYETDTKYHQTPPAGGVNSLIQKQELDHQHDIDSLIENSDLWITRFTEKEAQARASMAISMIEGFAMRWLPPRVTPERESAIELLTDVILDVLHAN